MYKFSIPIYMHVNRFSRMIWVNCFESQWNRNQGRKQNPHGHNPYSSRWKICAQIAKIWVNMFAMSHLFKRLSVLACNNGQLRKNVNSLNITFWAIVIKLDTDITMFWTTWPTYLTVFPPAKWASQSGYKALEAVSCK